MLRLQGLSFSSWTSSELCFESHLKKLLPFMHSALSGEGELQAKDNPALWNPTINVGDEQRDSIDRNARRARCALKRELVMEYLKSGGSGVWAARTWAAMEVWVGWLAAALNLNDNGLLPCSHSRPSKILLLTGRSVAAQTGHSDIFVRDGESPRHFFFATGEVS